MTDEAAITTAMALGVRSALPPQVREAFNASGTVHVGLGIPRGCRLWRGIFLLRFLIKQVRFRLLGVSAVGHVPPSSPPPAPWQW